MTSSDKTEPRPAVDHNGPLTSVTSEARERHVFSAGELPDDLFASAAASRMNKRHNHLNHLVEGRYPLNDKA